MKADEAADCFKALAHPHRLALFLRLARCCVKAGGATKDCLRHCIGELGDGLGIGQPTVSHHLKELRRAGLIQTRKCGQATECWVTEAAVDGLAHFLLRAKSSSRRASRRPRPLGHRTLVR